MLYKVLRITTLIAALGFAPALMADRTQVGPGWTMFSHQQDIEIGQRVATDLENQLSLFTDHNSNVYLDALGNQLATHSPGDRFSYQFKIVDDRSFNAWALPGGLIYVNRGVIESAQNQAQLAGVLAHEIAHVALRHGSTQISNAYSNTGTRRGLRGVSVDAVLSDLNIRFEPNSAPLKFTREQERQADVAAVQILHDSGFDPRAMTQIFQQTQNNSSRRAADFFVAHPAPYNFAAIVQTETQNVGGVPTNLRADNADFNAVKNVVVSAPQSSRSYRTADRTDRTDRTTRNAPFGRMVTYDGGDLRLSHPQNWRVSEDANTISIAPNNGMVSGSVALGMQIGAYEWRTNSRYSGQGLAPLGGRQNGADSLRQATDELLNYLRRSNPDMRNVQSVGQTRVDGQSALITQFTNASPLGGRENEWMVTVIRPGYLYYFIGVAPERDFNSYSATFEDMVASVRFY